MLRGTETDYYSARRRAARWLSRRKLPPSDLPSDEEIEAHIYAMARLEPGNPQKVNSGSGSTSLPLPSRETDAAASPGTVFDPEAYDPDTLAVFRMLLLRLEQVEQNTEFHPEGDALYHSLQVFELGRQAQPYDEEFLLACLLHDVGLGVDRYKPVEATLNTLKDLVTERTLFLIEHRHPVTEYLLTGQLARSLRRSEHFDDLVLLARCDLDGRVPGAEVPTVGEALDYIVGLAGTWDDAS